MAIHTLEICPNIKADLFDLTSYVILDLDLYYPLTRDKSWQETGLLALVIRSDNILHR
jgi:hypothetical protein